MIYSKGQDSLGFGKNVWTSVYGAPLYLRWGQRLRCLHNIAISLGRTTIFTFI
jgi:hypothetical protein